MGGRALLLVATAALAASGFLPWLRSGRRDRNGFELIDAARALDTLDSPTQRVLVLGMYLVPLATALCWLAFLLDRPRAAATIAAVTGLLGFLAAFSIERASPSALSGVRVALVASVAAVGGGMAELLKGEQRERLQQPS